MEHLAKPSEGEMKYVDENCQDISEFKGERKITKYGQQKKSKQEINEQKTNKSLMINNLIVARWSL
jgi:hypothetical protein